MQEPFQKWELFLLNVQLGGLLGQALGQGGEALVAAADHRVQTGALCWAPQHW